MTDLKQELLGIQKYNLSDSITMINILQNFAEKGITITDQDRADLAKTAFKDLPTDQVWALCDNLPAGVKAIVPDSDVGAKAEMVLSGKGWHKISTSGYILYYRDGEAVLIRETAKNPRSGETMINKNGFNAKFYAFTHGENNKLERDKAYDTIVKFDSHKQDLSDLSQAIKGLCKNLNHVYVYNLNGNSDTDTTMLISDINSGSDDNFLMINRDKDYNPTEYLDMSAAAVIGTCNHSRDKDLTYVNIPNYDAVKRYLTKDTQKYIAKHQQKSRYGIQVTYKGDCNEAKSYFKTINGYSLYTYTRYDQPKGVEYIGNFDSSHTSFAAAYLDEFNTIKITDQEIIDNLVAYLISETLKASEAKKLSTVLAAPIARLIYIQQKQLNNAETKIKKQEAVKKLSASLTYLLKHLNFNHNAYDDDQGEESPITIGKLVNYMQDVLNGRPVDRKMFKLIAQSKDKQFADDAAMQQALDLNIADKIRFATDDEISQVRDLLSEKNFKKVYKINDDKDLGEMNTKTLVHGTGNISVLNILGQGLIDADTLRKRHSQRFNYTASGLGRGVYFARPDQVEKSLNYTHDSDSYVFIAKVGYHKIKDVDYYNTNLNAGEADMVWAHGVGSYDRDELLCKNYKNIKLEYLVQYQLVKLTNLCYNKKEELKPALNPNL